MRVRELLNYRSMRSRQDMRRFLEDERGQSATDYMLTVSVITVAVVAAGLPFYDEMMIAVDRFGQRFELWFAKDGKPDTSKL